MKLCPRPVLLLLAMVGALLPMPWRATATLVAYYNFDGTVTDQTGQHPGTLFGTTNYVPGVLGQALNFSLNSQGQPTYVEVANPGTINFGEDFSISLWLKTTSQGQQDFLSKNVTNAWAYPGKQLMTQGGQEWVDANDQGDWTGNFNVTDGQWHHVMVTYCATISPYWAWYVDGNQANSYGCCDFVLGDDTAAQHIRIGYREDGSDLYYIGAMDELQIYDQTLTAAQAQYLYQNPGSVITNPPANPFTNTGTLFPRAATEAATTISTFNYAGLSTSDLFMMLTMQGCVNRIQPQVYLIGTGIVQMTNSLSSQFWLAQMPDYAQTNYTSAYQMIAAFTNDLNGCVLYNPSMFNATSDDDLAQINLVIMLCAKYGALACTASELKTLTNSAAAGGQNIKTLPVLANATTLPTTWTNIYTFALTNLAPGMQTGILHHLAGNNGTNFCLLPADYLVAQKVFTFNIPTNTTGTTALQSNILALTASNTPVIGCWGLDYGEGEHNFVAQMTGVGKFVTVTYETANLSFTTGLPLAILPGQTNRSLVLNTNMVYVAFCQHDGDNYSFVDKSWPLYLDVTNRLAYPFDWELCPVVNELNPVAAAWYYRNVGSTFVTSDAGVGYACNWNSANMNPQEPYLAPFLKLTDAYMGAMNQTFVRTIWTNYQNSLPWGALSHAIGVHVGYTGTGIAVSDVQSAAFISRGKAFFQGYDYTSQMTNIANYAGPTPAFFSVGHEVTVAQLAASAQSLPTNFMVVSETELANLYRQYKTNDVLASQNISGADFSPVAAAELLYLYDVEGAATNGTSGGSRYAHRTNFWVYQFNMGSGVTNVSATLTLYNNYLVSACNDGENWQVVAQAPGVVNNGTNLGPVTVNLTSFLGGAGNNLYLKFSDASPAQPGGVGLTYVQLIGQGAPPLVPLFITTPTNQAVFAGANATFAAVVSGSAPLSYQWYFNGTNVLANATSAGLTLTNVTASQAGAYTLLVSNSVGAVSATADLAVNLFTATPENETVIPGAEVTFTAVVAGSAPLSSYQWYFNGTNVLANATSARLTLANVTSSQAGTYTLVISNSAGTFSVSADLMVSEPLSGQYATGQWPMNEGSGPTLHNDSPNTTNWNMTIQGYTNSLWGYQQPGAYTFANGGFFETAITSASGWTSGATLTLTANFNVCGNAHNPGTIYSGGAVFGGGYYIPAGNAQGYNYGAFYAIVNTANTAAPYIEFDVSGISPGYWRESLPTSVCNPSVNGGWNTAQWVVNNNVASNSLILQFFLNGMNVGGAINVAGGYLRDFTSYSGYTGTEFCIGAAAAEGYLAFQGSISNVSLVATVPTPSVAVQLAGGYASLTINGQAGFTYAIQYADAVTPNTWQTLTNLTLSGSSSLWVDPQPVDNGPQRFYRAVVMP
jgi:hypothetical protein